MGFASAAAFIDSALHSLGAGEVADSASVDVSRFADLFERNKVDFTEIDKLLLAYFADLKLDG
jgi:hypothetical protein